MVKSMLASVPPAERNTPEGRREMKVLQMMLDQPHIDLTALEAIKVPTLILASDHDLIRDEHTLAIYHHIPNAQLAIFPTPPTSSLTTIRRASMPPSSASSPPLSSRKTALPMP